MPPRNTPLEFLVAFALAFFAGVLHQYLLSHYLHSIQSLRGSMPSSH